MRGRAKVAQERELRMRERAKHKRERARHEG